MNTLRSLQQLLSRVHSDERGAVSLETILILGAIALPVLVAIIKFGWPKMRDYFFTNLSSLNSETQKVMSNQ